MKKIKIGLIILSIILNVSIVKADTTGEGQTTISTIKLNNNLSEIQTIQNNLPECSNLQSCSINEKTNELLTYYNQNLKTTYPYYIITIGFGVADSNNYSLNLYYTNDKDSSEFDDYFYPSYILNNYNGYIYMNQDGTYTTTSSQYVQIIGSAGASGYDDITYYSYYDSNYNIESERDYEIANFYDDSSNIVINIGDKFPKIKDLLNYDSWSDYENNYLEGYTEVNLDNYEYVLLTLKDYNQTQAFQTNLQVKGQIGITPIYNYGQTSKDAVTGSQVQDRCNVSYENYTSYPFYIIQTDLQNNVVYAVKECSEGSSFKFDSNIFDITYITEQNEENPTVTINGRTYDVIPYDDLPSTATKNEEDNYIPGESGSATDTGGLDSAIKGAQNKMSEIWNTFTYFTSFIGQIFSSLPSEIHTVLLSAFTIMIILGIIKIFIGK